MLRGEKVYLKLIEEKDLEKRVEWINDPQIQNTLNYDIPTSLSKTKAWFQKILLDSSRREFSVFTVKDDEYIGFCGLFHIEIPAMKAEMHYVIGNQSYHRKGYGTETIQLLENYGFQELGLNRIYVYQLEHNIASQKAVENLGWMREGLLRNDLYSHGVLKNRYIASIIREDWEKMKDKQKNSSLSLDRYVTPIEKISLGYLNQFYIKREDLFPFSFGGNKARKAFLFFEEIQKGSYDYIITYGTSSSNHCRVVSNLAASKNLPCLIIGPEEKSQITYNRKMMELFGAEQIYVPVQNVHDTIEEELKKLRNQGYHPYFIEGGGHGDIGTQAYVDCYEEICRYENENEVFFDYIFFASGTGTTQAGLVCGQLMYHHERKIVGISIARKNPRGRDIVLESIRSYLRSCNFSASEKEIEDATIFLDQYTEAGYGSQNQQIRDTIRNVLIRHGIPLDPTYTGKAFYGMQEYLKAEGITGKNILFIHTGGTPLFFDYLMQI